MDQLWLQGTIAASALAVVFRTAGAAIRFQFRFFPLHVGGWILCATGAWFASVPGGAWTPLWLPVALGIMAGTISRFAPIRHLPVGADLLFVLLCFLLSVSPVTPVAMMATAILFVPLGMASDRLVRPAPAVLGWLSLAVPVAVFEIWDRSGQSLRNELRQVDRLYLPFLGVAVPNPGERLVLEGGQVAWVSQPHGDPRGGAIVFHGADPAGSHQKAAFAIQRALLAREYLVVSVDHPGFGDSPTPARGEPLSAWDPLRTAEPAYRYLVSRLPDGAPRILMGHSMGSSDVLRLLGNGVSPDAAVLMGASVPDSPEENDYWHARFHEDRGLTWQLPESDWLELQGRYYDNGTLASRLAGDHAPVLFIQFGVEWPNVRAQRGPLWEAIPGPKQRYELEETTHYLNTFEIFGLIVADVRVQGRLADAMAALPGRDTR